MLKSELTSIKELGTPANALGSIFNRWRPRSPSLPGGLRHLSSPTAYLLERFLGKFFHGRDIVACHIPPAMIVECCVLESATVNARLEYVRFPGFLAVLNALHCDILICP